MIQVAVDVMGGDHAPEEIIKGAVSAIKNQDDLKVTLVGKETEIGAILKSENYPSEQLEVLPAADVIATDEEPGLAVRRKKDSSMMMAIRQVKEGKADAVLSAGNTGALMTGGLLSLGRLKGIDRPALLTVFPTFKGKGVVVLDVGANMDAKPEHLKQYAQIGLVYAREVLRYSNPRCGLLNVGTENNKGNNQARKTFPVLEENIENFIGNIEARDIFYGKCDVVVCDGFVGNVLLKTTEGVAKGIFLSLREEFSRNIRNKIGTALLLPGIRRIRNSLDDAEYGGAPLVGVNGICIKCHGSSKARAVNQALLHQAYPMAKNQTNSKISKMIGKG